MTAAEVPAELINCTETDPIALMLPVKENGIENVNWLPKFVDAELW